MGYRSLQIEVVNSTGEKLVLQNETLQHGKWDTKPEDIASATNSTFKAESKDGALIGVTGSATWKGEADLGAFVISFNKPYGSGETEVNPGCPQDYKWELHGDTGGHKSSVKVIFSKL